MFNCSYTRATSKRKRREILGQMIYCTAGDYLKHPFEEKNNVFTPFCYSCCYAHCSTLSAMCGSDLELDHLDQCSLHCGQCGLGKTNFWAMSFVKRNYETEYLSHQFYGVIIRCTIYIALPLAKVLCTGLSVYVGL